MDQEWQYPATELQELAEEIIDEVSQHEHLRDKKDQIAYVFKLKKPRKWLGQASLRPSLDRMLHGFGAVITIVKPIWDTMSDVEKRYVMDHELCHLDVNEKDKLVLVDHDVQDFVGAINRHGTVMPSLRRLYRAFTKSEAPVSDDTDLDILAEVAKDAG